MNGGKEWVRQKEWREGLFAGVEISGGKLFVSLGVRGLDVYRIGG
jgi:hypothetical protein